MKPTFKNDPKYTGLAAVGNISGAQIKINGKEVGSISSANVKSDFRHRAQIAIKDENERIGWRWIVPRISFSSVNEAKQFLRENWPDIVGSHNLHFFDD